MVLISQCSLSKEHTFDPDFQSQTSAGKLNFCEVAIAIQDNGGEFHGRLQRDPQGEDQLVFRDLGKFGVKVRHQIQAKFAK